MSTLVTLKTGREERGNMTQLEQLEAILTAGGQEFNKTVDCNDTIVIQIVMYNDILVFYFNPDGSIKSIEEH